MPHIISVETTATTIQAVQELPKQPTEMIQRKKHNTNMSILEQV